jgi:hypothetical protein
MACGSCGSGRRNNTEYEVTLRDGTTKRVASIAEARILAGSDTTVGSRSHTIKAVPKIAKTS